ncbi:DUF922 domain-containing protein [Nitrosarchaeum sp.]|uniref:DUF922 domain-containing protein n=1 Tax=Nitrosarchaeum sp. TaxID=2026886 RepID=UPI00247EE442|nr:DUF922 domain-containing protein [Nitrosarchaeum sp.]MCV0411581.1 DUF922 domain-containing Zn-dependent protease [Nitrosarchaeum sp.]
MSEIRIPWSNDFQLTWDDFVGPIEQNNSQMAWTHTWLDYSYDIKLVERKTQTKFEITNIKVTAYYRKSISWVKSEMKIRSDQSKILKHEQGHLDLAELHARKIEKKMKDDFNGKHFSCKGKTHDEKQTFAQTRAKVLLDEIYTEGLKNWHRYESDYDEKTNHGLKDIVQIKYDSIFDKLRI